MSTSRMSMEQALEKLVVPHLKAIRFTGAFPHFRRMAQDGVDLLSFQFDPRGDSFSIEISRCSRNGVVTNWGQDIPPTEVTVRDLRPDLRYRVRPMAGTSPHNLFQYRGDEAKSCALNVLESLPRAEQWWSRRAEPTRVEERNGSA